VSAAERPTVAAPADPGLAAFERTVHDSGEWRARVNNLTGLVGQGLLRVVAVLGEFRIVDLALRTLAAAPESDSLGYVWASCEDAERCLRHVNHRVYGRAS